MLRPFLFSASFRLCIAISNAICLSAGCCGESPRFDTVPKNPTSTLLENVPAFGTLPDVTLSAKNEETKVGAGTFQVIG